MTDTEWVIGMDIIDMAREAGLEVTLDAKIGRVEYRSVCGSVAALERFAETLWREHDKARPEACAST
jgi:hypothetical protein